MKKVIYLVACLVVMTTVLAPRHAFALKLSKQYSAEELVAGGEACARIALLGLYDVDFDQLMGDPVAQVLALAVERIGLDPKVCHQSKLSEGQLKIISGNSD